MYRILFFEFEKIKSSKTIKFAFLLYLIFSFLYIYKGHLDYKRYLKETDNFIEYEYNKVKQYVNFDQYGGYGFRLLFMRPPMDIFFENNLAFIRESNIDTREIIKINNSHRGKSLFNGKSVQFSNSNLFFIFGTILCLYVGLTAFRERGNLIFYKSLKNIFIVIFSRFFIIEGFLIVSSSLVVAPVFILYQNTSAGNYIIYLLAIIVVFSFFYFSGFLISLLNSKRNTKIWISMIIWVILAVVVPEISNQIIAHKSNRIESIESVNLEKLKNLMEIERNALEKFAKKENSGKSKREIAREIASDYLNESAKKNKRLEEKIISRIKETLCSIGEQTTLFPTTFFYYLSNELSSNGYYAHIKFLKYIINLKGDFLKFYIKHKFSKNEEGRKVKSFIKNRENVFQGNGRFPKKEFYRGIIISLFYVLAMITYSLIFIKKKILMPKKSIKEDMGLKNGKTYFRLLKGEESVDEIESKHVIYLDCDKIFDLTDYNVTIHKIVKYLSYIRGVGEDIVKDKLDKMKFQKLWGKRGAELSRPARKILYSAFVLSENVEIFVIKDFIKDESVEFDKKFRELLGKLNEDGKTILYYSSEMLKPELKKVYNEFIKESIIEINLEEVSLR